jgi:hypothetical protein
MLERNSLSRAREKRRTKVRDCCCWLDGAVSVRLCRLAGVRIGARRARRAGEPSPFRGVGGESAHGCAREYGPAFGLGTCSRARRVRTSRRVGERGGPRRFVYVRIRTSLDTCVYINLYAYVCRGVCVWCVFFFFTRLRSRRLRRFERAQRGRRASRRPRFFRILVPYGYVAFSAVLRVAPGG